jgi:hypothetical protein
LGRGEIDSTWYVGYYKEPSIISYTGAAIWSKINSGLLANITLEVAPFHAYVPFLALLPFFKCILEIVTASLV